MSNKDDIRKPLSVIGRAILENFKPSQLYTPSELEEKRKALVGAGEPTWRILRYQRIIDPEKLPYPIPRFRYTRPETFEKHLQYLLKNCRVVSLDQLARRIESGEPIPDKTVAITIDGGWLDNFVYAFLPIRKYEVPVTMFLPTSFISSGNFFWQDKILFAMLIMKAKKVDFIPFDFFTPEQLQQLNEASPNGEISLPYIFLVISCLLDSASEDRRMAVMALARIAQHLGGDLPIEPAFMSWQDVEMMNNSSVTFGSLSHTHSYFHELTRDAMRQEIETSYAELEQHTSKISGVFAFPDGIIPEESLKVLEDCSINFATGIYQIPPPQSSAQPPILFGRLPIYEDDAYNADIFAHRLWLHRTYERL